MSLSSPSTAGRTGLARHLRPIAFGATILLGACGGGQERGSTEAPALQAQAVTPAAAASAPGGARKTFIVVLRPHVADPRGAADRLMQGRGGQIGPVYTRALRGFAATLPDAAVDAFLAALSEHADVDHVAPDVAVSAVQTVQPDATWGLDRLDQRTLPLSGTYAYTTAATGVTAYIVDTGILASHLDFGGRVRAGFTAIADGQGTRDCNGHGTHIAGTLGGLTWGVAKGVGLVPVRVLDCAGAGTVSGVIAGLDWMLANATRPAVGNLSLVGGLSTALDTAVANTVAAGIPMVVAAGNDAQDACNASPARTPEAITVGATTRLDARASFSNWGTCLDLFAPGDTVRSADIASTTAFADLSGTSMATPHVAGLAAIALAGSPTATPAQVDGLIRAATTQDVVTDAGTGSPNRLAYTGIGTLTTPPTVPLTSVAVGTLSGKGVRMDRAWQAQVTVSVRTTGGTAVAGAVVTGGFSVGGTALNCTTGSSGQCSLVSGLLGNRTPQTVFSVTGITGTGLRYDAARNSASSVVVKKP